MNKTVVINAVGLTPALVGALTPRLHLFSQSARSASIGPVLPAVTCSVQATYLTGAWPAQHGIVGNGWYFHDECEVKFWRQSDRLVQRPRIWDIARTIDPAFTCANLFWWYNMYSSADVAVTPRPMYPADGRKIPDIWTNPPELRQSLQQELGQFPLFQFWGPATSIRSTQWIADAAIRVDAQYDPTLTLIYLPHLDYCLQRHGPDTAAVSNDLTDLDRVCGQLIDHYESRGARVIILSEYGIAPVSRQIHINRLLRRNGLITVREELGRELLDAGASKAFAVADHQVAHVYVNDRDCLSDVHAMLRAEPGIEQVLDKPAQRAMRLDHPRSGDLLAIAADDAYFTYYYWLDDARMPDFARTVDIHRKPGYDPAELFLDPAIHRPKLKIAWTLLRKKLGFRTLLDVIPPDGALVKGSHGRTDASANNSPLLMTRQAELLPSSHIEPTEVFNVIMAHLTGQPASLKPPALPRQPRPQTSAPIAADEAEQYASTDFAGASASFVDRLLQLASERPSAAALDIGTGPAGMPIRILRKRETWRIVAVDSSQAMLDLAGKAIGQAHLDHAIRLVRADAAALPLEDHSFDLIFSNDVLHQMNDEIAFWREIRRLIKPNGLIFVRDRVRPHTPDAVAALVDRFAGGDPDARREELHSSLLSAYTADEIRRQLRDAGLDHARVLQWGDAYVEIIA